jgi:hypothetical protein
MAAESGGISGGKITGIVLGSLLLLAIMIATTINYCKRNPESAPESVSDNNGSEPIDELEEADIII